MCALSETAFRRLGREALRKYYPLKNKIYTEREIANKVDSIRTEMDKCDVDEDAQLEKAVIIHEYMNKLYTLYNPI